MRNNLILIFLLLFYSVVYSQVGINTPSPKGVFHVDGAKNNPESGNPSVDQQKDDFVISNTGVVSIGTINPSPYSSLEIESNKGLRLPQLTSAQILTLDAIPSNEMAKKNGLTIYNTTTKCINYWADTEWLELCGSQKCNPVSGTPTISPPNPDLTVGSSSSFTVSGVSNATSYVWKVNGTIQNGQNGNSFSYTPTDTNPFSISVVAYGCNNSSTTEVNSGSMTAMANCTPVSGTLTISPQSVNINTATTQRFTASGATNATSYEWRLNGAVVQNTSSNYYDFNTITEGNYTLSVTAYGDCNSSISAATNATINVTFVCTEAGRFFKAGTDCAVYNFCTKMSDGSFVKQTYTCPAGSKFDYINRYCSQSAPTCPF